MMRCEMFVKGRERGWCILLFLFGVMASVIVDADTVTAPTIQFGYGTTTNIIISPSGTKLAIRSSDSKIRIWDLTTGTILQTFDSFGESANSSTSTIGEMCVFSQNESKVLLGVDRGESSGSQRYQLAWFDLTTGSCLSSTEGQSYQIEIFKSVVSPDKTKILYDGKLYSINPLSDLDSQMTEPYSTISNFKPIQAGPSAFSNDGTKIAVAYNNYILLYSSTTGDLIKMIPGASSNVVFAPDGTKILSGLKLFNVETGAVIRTFTWDSGYTNFSGDFSPDGACVVIGSWGVVSNVSSAKVKVFDVDTGAVVMAREDGSIKVDPKFCNGGSSIFMGTGSYSGSFQVCNVSTGMAVLRIEGYRSHWESNVSMNISPDGTTFMIGQARLSEGFYDDLRTFIYDTLTGEITGQVTGMLFATTRDKTKSLAFMNSNKSLALVVGLTDTEIWSSNLVTYSTTSVAQPVFSNDEKKVYILLKTPKVSGTGEIYSIGVLNAANGMKIGELGPVVETFANNEYWRIDLMMVSQDDKKILVFARHGSQTGGLSGSYVSVLDSTTGAEMASFTPDGDSFVSVGFSPDLSKILAGSTTNTIATMWDIATGAEIQLFAGPISGTTGGVAFSPDGSRIAVGYSNKTVRLFEPSTGTVIREFFSVRGCSRFTPNGKGILSLGGEVPYLWDLGNIPSIPVPPANPGTADIAADGITWTWQDNADNETGYKLWADAGSSEPVTLLTTTAENFGSWRQTGLTPNTQYTFQVAATNDLGDSTRTVPYTAWTLAAAPAAPIVGTPVGNTLPVSIGDDTNPAGTRYAIEVTQGGKSGNAKSESLWVQADGTLGTDPVYRTAAEWGTVTVSTLYDYTTYTFSVVVQNGAGVTTPATASEVGTTVDGPPWTVITPAAPITPTTADSLTFYVVFSEAIDADLSSTDVVLTPGSLAGSVAVTGSGKSYTVTVTMDDPNADGTIGITLPAGVVTDLMGHEYTGGASALCSIHNWPDFSTQPQEGKHYVGDSLSVEIEEAGVPTSYQWKCETDAKALINGPTTPSWVLGATAVDGEYWCEVTYDGVSHTSTTASVQVRPHINITSPPTGGDASIGDNFVFSVIAQGGYGMLTYQWMKGTQDLVGETESTLLLSKLTLDNSGWYRVVITDENTDSEVSTAVKLDVAPHVPAFNIIGLALLGIAIVGAGCKKKR